MAERNGEQSQKPSNNWVAFGRQLLGTLQAILGALAFALVFVIIILATKTPLLYGFSLAAAAGIGLLGGFYTRLIMRKSLTVIRFLAGLVAALFGLIAFDIALTLSIGLSGSTLLPGWLLIVQAFLAGFCVWLSLTAWSKDRLKRLKKSAQVRRARREKRRKLNAKRHQKFVQTRLQTVHPAARRPAAKAEPLPTIRVQPKPASATSTKKRRSKKVTVARYEKHRCPYCLEEVKANDPRGVKICSVCGAWHHKDCWDITGHCQVPHSGNAHI